MTKVEELRDRLRHVTPSAWYGVIDETIAAAIEEGMAQEHQKISNDIADILFNARRPFLDVVFRDLKEKVLPEVYGDSLPVKEK